MEPPHHHPMTENPDDALIQAALRAVPGKRSKTPPPAQRARGWESIVGRSLPLPDSEYCPTCDRPLILVNGKCEGCADDAKGATVELLRKMEMIGGAKLWRESTLDGPPPFEPTHYNALALERVQRFDPRRDNILLWGPRGTGKSRMCAMAKRRAIDKGVPVMTVSMPAVVDTINANRRLGRWENELITQMIAAPVLSIEDIGAGEKMTETVVKLYFRVIDGRYTADKAGLLLTTNFSLEEVESAMGLYDRAGRVKSRIDEMCTKISLQGEKDWRSYHGARRT
jgi:DNA replication protein DnaC